MPPRPRRLTDSDEAHWSAFTRTIAPLKPKAQSRKQALPGSPAPAEPPKPAMPSGVEPARQPRPVAFHPPRPAGLVTGEAPAGLDRASWNRFRSGRIVTARTLDLHGRTVQSAYLALQRFLLAAHADHVRCVEVITGRGSGEQGGQIRRELPHWLNQPPLRALVLAAAHPHAANPGSTRLLLRKPGR